MAKGMLQVRVVQGNSEFPVGNANVIITKSNEKNEKNIEYQGKTDSSGNTEFVELEAPDLLLSQSPFKERPYSVYVVNVNSDDYHDLEIVGTQVFPEVIAIQYARVTSKEVKGQEESEIIIPDHSLVAEYPEKRPEEPLKLIPIPIGGIQLEAPEIPYYLVVHLGAPDDKKAPNIKVRFIDYIKGVCSGGIYPTWTEAAIRTFSYCVISFVLNRIYTQWYRKQGKDFDITNDTVYDQAFFSQRTIYSNISEIINAIFNTYVTKFRQVQPMLTQYSDGIKVSRKGWLSKWGSKFLADDGTTSIEILRYYYGDDIILNRTQKIQDIPEQYPGSPLIIGSVGKSVRTIQEYINRISIVYSNIPKVVVNGDYDLAIAEVVKEYQKLFKSRQTGIVDFATWYSIARLYVQVSGTLDSGSSGESLFYQRMFIPPIPGRYGEYIPVIHYPTS